MKKTLVMGASPHAHRYANKAARLLKQHGHEVVAFGREKGDIDGIPIIHEFPSGADFDTVTLYLNPGNQKDYIDPILNLKPKRVVFNPGTENPEFENKLEAAGIEALEACTLVMLGTGQY